MTGGHIRATATAFPPIINPCTFNTSCSSASHCTCVKGAVYDFSAYFLQYLNMSFSLVPATSVIHIANGVINETSMIGQLHHGDAEINFFPMPLTEAAYNFTYGITNPVYDIGFTFMVKMDYHDQLTFLLLKPFQMNLWLLAIASYFFLICSKRILNLLFPNATYASASYFRTGGLVATVILNVYSSILTIQLYIPPEMIIPFHSFEELSHKVLSSDLRLVFVSNGTAVFQRFGNPATIDTKNVIFNRLAQAAKINPPLVVNNPDIAADYLLQSNHYVLITDEFAARYLEAKHCHLIRVSDETIAKDFLVFYFGKHFPKKQLPAIDSRIGNLYERGFKRYCERAMEERNCTEIEVPTMRSLTLVDCFASFLIVCVGAGIALIAFAVEISPLRSHIKLIQCKSSNNQHEIVRKTFVDAGVQTEGTGPICQAQKNLFSRKLGRLWKQQLAYKFKAQTM